jgi:hypothetical protein
MTKTAAMEHINQNQFSLLMEMLKTLLDAGKISREEADSTAQRIASEYELIPIYLW